jgi:hypothetical protein
MADRLTVSKSELDELIRARVAEVTRPEPEPDRALEYAAEALDKSWSVDTAARLLAAWAESNSGIAAATGLSVAALGASGYRITNDVNLRASNLPGAEALIARAIAGGAKPGQPEPVPALVPPAATGEDYAREALEIARRHQDSFDRMPEFMKVQVRERGLPLPVEEAAAGLLAAWTKDSTICGAIGARASDPLPAAKAAIARIRK